MAKIIEIDLDKNIVIPINGTLSKEDFVTILSEYWKYNEGQEEVVRKEFEGDFEDFKKEFEGKKYSVLEIKDNKIIYDLVENTPHLLSKTEFVIKKYLEPSTDKLINIMVELQTKQDEEKKKEFEKEIEAKKSAITASLESIKDVKLQ
jgi:hypothetical protein